MDNKQRGRILSCSLLFLIAMTAVSGAQYTQDYNNFLTRSVADYIYCLRSGSCSLSQLFVENLTVQNLTVLSYFNATVVNYNVTGNMQVEGNISADYITSNGIIVNGNVTADYYHGDGSQLTGIQQGELILYFLMKNVSCSFCPTNKSLSAIKNLTEVTLTGAGLPDGNTLFWDWITEPNSPNINLLLGNMRVHVSGAKTAGTKNVQFFFIVYRTNLTGGDDYMLAISEYTPALTATRTSYRIWALANETDFNTTDRIRVKGYAFVSGGGSAPTVEAYIQGESNTRLILPVEGVSVEKFVPYTNAIYDLNLGSKNLYATNISFDTIFGMNWQNATNGLNLSWANITEKPGFLINDSIINATILNVTQKVNTWNLTVKGNTTLASYTYFNSTTNTYTGYGGICFNGSTMVISSNVTRSIADTTNPWCK